MPHPAPPGSLCKCQASPGSLSKSCFLWRHLAASASVEPLLAGNHSLHGIYSTGVVCIVAIEG
eukprot:scaffold54246_cov17-Tisochrysis_lutea.AAC.1